MSNIHAAALYGYTLRLFGFSITVCSTKGSYRTIWNTTGNHPVLRLLKNYHDTTICRGEAILIDYRLCTLGTFSAVSSSGGFETVKTFGTGKYREKFQGLIAKQHKSRKVPGEISGASG
jgi:hypothetical protein